MAGIRCKQVGSVRGNAVAWPLCIPKIGMRYFCRIVTTPCLVPLAVDHLRLSLSSSNLTLADITHSNDMSHTSVLFSFPASCISGLAVHHARGGEMRPCGGGCFTLDLQ
jgi:hypothetical protein